MLKKVNNSTSSVTCGQKPIPDFAGLGLAGRMSALIMPMSGRNSAGSRELHRKRGWARDAQKALSGEIKLVAIRLGT
jgi:hypothetical protein